MEHSKNSVSLKGNVVAKPEVKTLDNGTTVASFSLGVNERYENKKGETIEEASYFDIVMYGDKAAALANTDKGAYLQVDGKLQQDRWQGEDGKQKSRMKILAFDVKTPEKTAEKGQWTNNSLSLMGNLTDAPKVKEFEGGKKVAEVSIGVNNDYQNKSGETIHEVSFVTVEAWGDRAEQLAKYEKGAFLQLNGKLKQDRWQGEDGKVKSKIKMVPFEIKPIEKKIEKEHKKSKDDDYGYSR